MLRCSTNHNNRFECCQSTPNRAEKLCSDCIARAPGAPAQSDGARSAPSSPRQSSTTSSPTPHRLDRTGELGNHAVPSAAEHAPVVTEVSQPDAYEISIPASCTRFILGKVKAPGRRHLPRPWLGLSPTSQGNSPTSVVLQSSKAYRSRKTGARDLPMGRLHHGFQCQRDRTTRGLGHRKADGTGLLREPL